MRRIGYVLPVVAATAAGAFGFTFPSTADAAMCAMPAERAAIDTRVLQTELMVAALTCDQKPSYNRFVGKFKPELVANGKALRGYFHRVHGRRGEAEVTRFVTRLANNASARSLTRGTPQYCAAATALFREVLSVDPKHFRAYVANRDIPPYDGIESCQREAKAPK